MLNLRICFLGAGNMAEALIKGLLEKEVLSPEQISINDIKKERLEYLSKEYKVLSFEDKEEALKNSEVIIISVKPDVVDKVIEEISSFIRANKLLISIAAGITTSYIENKFKEKVKVIRVMPNMPALIGEGISAISLGRYVNKEEEEITNSIFKAVGEVVKVEESLMNAITALSGSGPAYVFNFIEALVDAGVELGINRKLSTKLVIETVKGATSSLIKSGEHPVYMKEKITSPGGTTIKALNTLERYGFKAALISAVKEAAKRAEEISLKE